MASVEPVQPIDDLEVGRYGLRTFAVDYRRRQLRAVTQRFGKSEWIGATCVARCRISETHNAPMDHCACGIYATNSLEGLKQFGGMPHDLVAVIAAEGKTIIGDKGLRTAYARVVAYWTPNPFVRRICVNQFSEAKRYRGVDEMLTAYRLPRGDTRIGRGFRVLRSHLAMLWLAWCALWCLWDIGDTIRYILLGNLPIAGLMAVNAVAMACIGWSSYRHFL